MSTKKTDFDVIVIGGGPGGVASAVRVSQLGGKVCLVEKADLGGICMNRGCIPYSHMMMAVSLKKKISTLGRDMGIKTREVKIELSTLIKRQSRIISSLRASLKKLLMSKKVEVLKGRAKIIVPGRIQVNGNTLSCKKIIIATGSRWDRPESLKDIAGKILNSDHILNLKEIKGSFLISGSSPFAMEIAQYLKSNGGEVYLITEQKRLLEKESKAICSRISKLLKEQGIKIITGQKISSCKWDKGRYRVSLNGIGDTVVVDHMVFMKRVPNLEGVMIDGLLLDESNTYIRVNERMETSIEGIYAVGDVGSPEEMHFSHLASAGGIVAAENSMGIDSHINLKLIPRVIYTYPQLAFIGLTKQEAKEKGFQVITGSAPLSMNPYGMILAQDYGHIEVVADKRYGEIMGIHMIGDGVCELAGQGVLAIQMEATLRELFSTAFPHPSLSESIIEAMRQCSGEAIFLP